MKETGKALLGMVRCKCKHEYISQVIVYAESKRMEIESPCPECGFHQIEHKILKEEIGDLIPTTTVDGPKSKVKKEKFKLKGLKR